MFGAVRGSDRTGGGGGRHRDVDTACSRRKRRHRSVAPAADNATLFKLSSRCVARPAEPLPQAPRPFGRVLGANSRRRRYRQ